jgi:hypothetical protein
MSRLSNVYLPIGLAAFCAISFRASVASAGFLDSVNSVIRGVNNTTETVRGTAYTVNNLNSLLGISPGQNNRGNGDSAASIDQVLGVYETWYKGLPEADKGIVSQFVMAYATEQTPTFATIAGSDWFKTKTPQEQQKVGELFFKFNQIVQASASDKNQFLSFAFCVNNGSPNCKPQK